jgi:thiol-disulfide isomerase/thioredoxin
MKRPLLFFIIPVVMVVAALWLVNTGNGTPTVTIRDPAQIPVKITQPYDEKADANAAVDAAFARARVSGKRVLIDLGGNWCPDCIVLANIMALPKVKPWLEHHFEIVAVDVGRFDRNLQVPARFGITGRLKGVPTVLVATPEGRLVNTADPFTLANASAMSPQATVNWLGQWIAPPR